MRTTCDRLSAGVQLAGVAWRAALALSAAVSSAAAQAAVQTTPVPATEVVAAGRGTASLPADRATLTFEVVARGVGAAVAAERHAALVAAVAEAARAAGAPRDGVAASARTLGTGQWFNRAAGIDSIGYVAEGSVRVTLAAAGAPGEAAGLGRVVDAVRAAGATGFGGVTWWATDSAPARAAAVARAVGAACRDAAAAARAAGLTLGPLAGVVVNGVGTSAESDAPPPPVVWKDGRSIRTPGARSTAAPLTVTAAVTARWAVRARPAGVPSDGTDAGCGAEPR